ncbi:hypothetical protein SDC9_210606 [bioreactor metagenome]|uniref:Uncharacterized protein n=1 Tax=bioreactor metagenome TaxID=1076179 RepID=A0A645JUB1_9ZZZZ
MGGKRRDALDHHRAELRDIIQLVVFIAVAESTGCGHDRILQLELAQIDAQINRHSTPRPLEIPGLRHSCAHNARCRGPAL